MSEIVTNYNRSLYILGTSFKGPTNMPILVENSTEGMSLFGDSFLLDAWYEAKQVMGDDVNVYLVRINGEPATLNVQGVNMDQRKRYNPISLTSYDSGEIWNNASIEITKEYIRVSNPDDIGGSVELSIEDNPTVGHIVNGINFAFGQGAIGIMASTITPHRPSTDIIRAYMGSYDEPIYLMGGSDEAFFTKNELHHKLQMTYNILEGQAIDVITVVGAYFDDVTPIAYEQSEVGELFYKQDRDYLELPDDKDESKYATFHGQMIDFCKKQMSFSIMTHGVLAFNPVENIEDFISSNAYLTKAMTTTCLSDRYDIIRRNGETAAEDNGKFISIVLGDFEYVDLRGNLYYNNGYIGYAALVASTLTSQSFTNMIIPNINNLRYYLEDEESHALSKVGVTTFRKSILKNGIVVGNGVTASLSSSPYHIVSNVRMVQMILNTFNNALEDFVGENVDLLIKNNSIQIRADEIAKALMEANVAKDVEVECTISKAGYALVKVSVMPIYSTEYVHVTSTVKL